MNLAYNIFFLKDYQGDENSSSQAYGQDNARILFFDSNPIGRILTRFTKDINIVDEVFYERSMATIIVSAAVLNLLS